MKSGIRLLGLVLGAVVLAAGCGTGGDSEDPRPSSPAVTEEGQKQQETPAPVEALRFTATTVDGQEFAGESLAGKPAVLWFWAAWCPVCEGEAPGVANAAESNAGTVEFVGVAALSDTPAMQDFVDRTGIGSFANIADTDSAVWQRFGVTAQPAYAFISPNGTVDTVKGSLSEDELTAKIDQLTAS